MPDDLKYTVKRGSRMDQAKRQLLYNRVADALPENYPARVVDLEVYAKLVTHTVGVSGLKTMADQPYDLPPFEAATSDHVKSFSMFLESDPTITDMIAEEIDAANQPIAPRHVLPANELTDDERADPNSAGGESATLPGSTPSPAASPDVNSVGLTTKQ